MAIERWEASRGKWILYTSQQDHRDDCAKYPFEAIPKRVFLDTNVVNILVKHAVSVFELGEISSAEPISRANEIEALIHIFQVGQRAGWDLVASNKTMEEILLTPDPDIRSDLLDYVMEIVETGTEESFQGNDFGRRLADASIVSALPDRNDRELLGNAIGLGCDAFCTCDRRTIIDKRHFLPALPLRILTPLEWWAHVKPWAGLWI